MWIQERERERDRAKLLFTVGKIANFFLSGLVTLPESAGRKRTAATSATV